MVDLTIKIPQIMDIKNNKQIYSKGEILLKTNENNHIFYEQLIKKISRAEGKLNRNEINIQQFHDLITEEVETSVNFYINIIKTCKNKLQRHGLKE